MEYIDGRSYKRFINSRYINTILLRDNGLTSGRWQEINRQDAKARGTDNR